MTKRENTDVFQRIKGELYLVAKMLEFIDQEGDIVIATDGTLKKGKGGVAYIVNSVDTPGTLKAVLPVDGDGRQMMSYRTELFGILKALLTLKELLQIQGTWWKQQLVHYGVTTKEPYKNSMNWRMEHLFP